MTGSGRGSGSAPLPGRHPPSNPSSARAALDTVSATKAQRRQDPTEVTDADLWERIGPIGGPCAARPRVGWVLHALDEVIHHGAEIGLLVVMSLVVVISLNRCLGDGRYRRELLGQQLKRAVQVGEALRS
jgi:hypothetical protein